MDLNCCAASVQNVQILKLIGININFVEQVSWNNVKFWTLCIAPMHMDHVHSTLDLFYLQSIMSAYLRCIVSSDQWADFRSSLCRPDV